jgi:glycosyltransferase involved in cell wall biosynthesis
MPDVDAQLKIMQVNTMDSAGGAAKIAWNLFQAYRYNGHRSSMAVGWKRSDDLDVLVIPNAADRSYRARACLTLNGLLQPVVGRIRGMGRLQSMLRWVGEPGRWSERQRGLEDFRFPGTWHLLNLTPERPDIVHCHNLHGDYFDLRALPWLTHEVPVILTLHDAWLLGGHCAHSFDCERWRSGCGQCPDLTIPPAVRRDATAEDWRRKQRILQHSRLYVASPSRWLLDRARQSILAPAIIESRIIPNGVDLTVFHPSDRAEARAILGLPGDAWVLLFVANGIRENVWKDYRLLRQTVANIAERLPKRRVLFLALGEEAPEETVGAATIRFVPFRPNPTQVARYYQAADVYLHAARAENHSLAICEALACGAPVVATAVGGIAEQVRHGETGLLVAPGDAEGMAAAIRSLLTDPAQRAAYARQARADAEARFDKHRMVDEYLAWYKEILAQEERREARPAWRPLHRRS